MAESLKIPGDSADKSRMDSRKIVFKKWHALALYLGLTGCTAPTSRPGSTNVNSYKSESAGVDALTRDETLSLFKDRETFQKDRILDVMSLGGARTNCETVTAKGTDLTDNIIPWPSDLKEFLASEIMDLPVGVRKLAGNSLDGIYLVSEESLKASDGVIAAGLACDRGDNNKGLIFLNEYSFLTERQTRGSLGSFQSYSLIPLSTPNLMIESGDNAAITLIHEIFHAIDNKLYQGTRSSELRKLRLQAQNLSWSNNESLYPNYSRGLALALAVGEAGLGLKASIPHFGCRLQKAYLVDSDSKPLGLAPVPPQELADELQNLAESTNFIVPYTQMSQSEDFAESLAVYYFGAYKKSWQVRKVYAEDLSKVPIKTANLLYKADTKAILQSVDIQREKICTLAKLVFGDDYETCKSRINGAL